MVGYREVKKTAAHFAVYVIPPLLIFVASVYFATQKIHQTLQDIGDHYMVTYERIINGILDENRAALIAPNLCHVIQQNMRYEREVEEQQTLRDGQVICSSLSNTSALYPLTDPVDNQTIDVVPLPNSVDVSLAVINSREIDGELYHAVSLVDRDYIRARLGYLTEPNINSAVLIVNGKIAPAGATIPNSWFVYSTQSSQFGHRIVVEASSDLIRETTLYYVSLAALALIVLYIAVFLLRIQLSAERSMYAEIKLALRRNEFVLHYQPQVDAACGRTVGVEALVRWQHPTRGLIYPDVFIPVMEEFDLINELTDVVVKQAWNDWCDRHFDAPFHLGINFPPGYFASAEKQLFLVNHHHQFAKRNIVLGLEVTERQLLDGQAREGIAKLREKGLEVLIDDFGTGQTSLAVLEQTKIDVLKIDKCFVDTIGVDSVSAPVLNAIINLAKALNLTMIAEGVEYAEQADYLLSQGVNLHQGYLYSKPVPLGQLDL